MSKCAPHTKTKWLTGNANGW